MHRSMPSLFQPPGKWSAGQSRQNEAKEYIRTSSAAMTPGIELESRGKVKHGNLINSSRKDVRRECVNPPNVLVSAIT